MNHANSSSSSIDTRFQHYRNIRNNLRKRHGSFRSTAARFEQSRVHRFRGHPQQQHQFPIISHSDMAASVARTFLPNGALVLLLNLLVVAISDSLMATGFRTLYVDLHIYIPLPRVESTAEYYDLYHHEEDDDEDEDEEGEERLDNDGLTEQTILDCLSTKIHYKSANQEPEICVVCQNEHEEDQILGCLDCGHEYHVDCITRWLLQQNHCPVCKRPALLAAEDAEDVYIN